MPNNSGEALNELNDRAKNILGISGNMRLESFCKKLVTYRGTINDVEGVAALVSGKPTTMWFDQDFENAKVNLQEFAREFRVLEAHANLLDRPNLSNVFAILQKDDVSKAVQISEFSVLHSEQSKVEAMVAELRKTIDSGEDVSIDIQLAALFKLATEFNELKASIPKETNV